MGILIALGCALTWSISIICFRKAGEQMHPYSMNAFKNILGTLLCLLTLLASGTLITGFQNWGFSDWGLAILSGIIGIGVADALALYALQKVGAGRFAIIESVYAPSVILGSYFLFHEIMTFWQITGIVLVLGAMGYMTFDQHRHQHDSVKDGSRFWGILSGILSIILMAGGILIVKPLFEKTSLLSLVSLRLAAGAITSYILYASASRRSSPIRNMFRSEKFPYLVAGSLFGTYISMLLWLGGFKYERASIVAVVNQTSTILTVLMAYFYLGESLKKTQVIAIAVVVLGILCMTLFQ